MRWPSPVTSPYPTAANRAMLRGRRRARRSGRLVYTTGMGVLAPLRRCDRRTMGTVVRHQRDRRLARHRGRGATPGRGWRVGRIPVVAECVLHHSVANARGLRGHQGRAGQARRGWRIEHPEIGFTRLAVGDSLGGTGDAQTEFNKSWDPEVLDTAIRYWMENKYMLGGLIDVEHLTEVVNSVIRCGNSSFIPYLTLAPRSSDAVKELRQW